MDIGIGGASARGSAPALVCHKKYFLQGNGLSGQVEILFVTTIGCLTNRNDPYLLSNHWKALVFYLWNRQYLHIYSSIFDKVIWSKMVQKLGCNSWQELMQTIVKIGLRIAIRLT
ncbi:MAG TPA: hypothetical protein VN726_03325 [Hanamia sp.]|nr:hypothetical protein [Hanamia sp.]